MAPLMVKGSAPTRESASQAMATITTPPLEKISWRWGGATRRSRKPTPVAMSMAAKKASACLCSLKPMAMSRGISIMAASIYSTVPVVESTIL